MIPAERTISSADDLNSALADATISELVVTGTLSGLQTIRLPPGFNLRGRDAATLRFLSGHDGVQLTSDNLVEGVEIATDVEHCAVFNDTSVATLGHLRLRDLRVFGNVRLLAKGAVRAGHVEIDGLDIVAADARGWNERPSGFGVEVVPGVFTLWNQQADASVQITAVILRTAIGRIGAPVRGTGVFVAGFGAAGGAVAVSALETGEIYSDGGITPGTADLIAAGVFTSSGAVIERVHNRGSVTTYGVNDMALDNWGSVDRWVAEGKITSLGQSAIGFVNFGDIDRLQVTAPIETHGEGARGFNVYAGTIRVAEFDRVVTRGDGAVGIQISQPVDHIQVRNGVETYGAIGASLVKGVIKQLPATALSIKPGGRVGKIEIAGGLRSHGVGVAAIEVHGEIERLVISDGLSAAGGGFDAV